ncbi:MAG TPA: SRPBCC family protein [Streptosporangiaceae bacterium]
MKLDNEFTVGVPVSQAWGVLTDLEVIAPCMPGAQLTGVNDGVYTGKVKIKVGPVTAEYSGTARFTEKDDATYRAVIDARGRDSRGNGNATAVISAQLRADGDSTVVNVTTDLTIAGRVAQFGSGMIKEVSAKLLGQFVQCLEGKLGADLPVAADPSTAGAVAADTGVAAAVSGGAAASAPVPAATGAVSTGAAAAGAAAAVGAAVASSAEPEPIDLMSVAGSAVYKRLVPLVIGIVVLAVLIYLIVR